MWFSKTNFESDEGEDEKKENGTEQAEKEGEHADTEEGMTEGEDKHE